MRISKLTATGLIIVCLVGGVIAIRFIQGKAAQDASLKIELSRTKGNLKGKVHIVEYLDFQCPACAAGAIALDEYFKNFPNDIYLQVRYFPISRIHAHAIISAMYAECAARQNKFWEFEKLLVERQTQWAKLLNADSEFRGLAQLARVDLTKLEACVNDDSVKLTILKEKSEGKALGVDSTPTYFINGKMVVGPKPLKEELGKYFGGEKKDQ